MTDPVQSTRRPGPPHTTWDWRLDGAALAFVIATSLALQLLVYDRWISLLDEGVNLQIADEINHGGVLYRDAVHLAWPGVFYLIAGLFQLFGTNVLITRWAVVVAFSTLVSVVYVLARGVSRRSTALGAALVAVAYRMWVFPHWQMIGYAPLALLFLTIGGALLAAHVQHPSRTRLFAAALIAGIAVVFKQDVGGLGFIAFTVFLWLDRPPAANGPAAFSVTRRAASFAAVALVPAAFTGLAFITAGLGRDMFHQTVWVPLVGGKLWALPTAAKPHPYLSFPPLWPPFSSSEVIKHDAFFNYFPSLLTDLYWRQIRANVIFQQTVLPEVFVRTCYLLPYVTLALLGGREIWRAWVGQRSQPAFTTRRLRSLLLLGTGVLLAFNRPRDWIHLTVLYPPTLILLAPLFDLVAGTGPSLRRRLASILGILVVTLALLSSFALALATRDRYDTPIPTDRAGVFVKATTARVLGELVEALQETNGEPPRPLAALPYHPMLNFLAGRPLGTRILTVLPLEKFPDRQQQVLDNIVRDPRTDVVYVLQHFTGMPRPFDYAPALFAGLTERYRLGRVFNDAPLGLVFGLLEPRGPRESEQVLYDFTQHLERATLKVIGKRVDEPAVEIVPHWPFEGPILSIRPSVWPSRTSVSYVVDVPEPARLRFGVAMNPDEWRHIVPLYLRFTIRAEGTTIFDTTLDPRRALEDRRWVWADVLLPHTGRQTIEFQTSTESHYGAVDNLAGFARPRLVVDPSSHSTHVSETSDGVRWRRLYAGSDR